MTDELMDLDGQITWQDRGFAFGKTYQEPLVRDNRKGQTSKESSRSSFASQTRTLPMCLCLKTESGASRDACTMIWVDGALLGDYTMHSFGESPNEENVSHLSQILVDDPLPKYSLSAKACQGILNRASRKGKALPEVLREALERQTTYEEM